MPGYLDGTVWNFEQFNFQTANWYSDSYGWPVWMSESMSYLFIWDVNANDWFRCGNPRLRSPGIGTYYPRVYNWTSDQCNLEIWSAWQFPGMVKVEEIDVVFNKIQIYMAWGPDKYGHYSGYDWEPNWMLNITGPTIFTNGEGTYAPTPEPTLSPTTADPTAEPTNEPTKNPTREPTSIPTLDPTMEPTNDPSTDPTQMPSDNPTTNPTSDPSVDPTSDPTNDPTTEPTVFVDDTESAFSSWIPSDFDDLGLQHIMYLVLLSFGLLIFISLIYSKCIQVNDFYKIGALLAVTIHFNDSLSDAFFCLSVSFHDDSETNELTTIFALSIIFILIPSGLTLYQLYHSINQWRRNDELSQWLTHNIKLLYIISILTGSSFAGVRLCSSNLFNMAHFDMPISKTKLIEFQTQSIYSIVLLEVTYFPLFVYCAFRRTW